MTKFLFKIGKNKKLDKNVQLGYIPERLPKFSKLVIGDNARIRSGTVIYAGSSIGDNLVTGHNVVIREENMIGDDFSIWSNSVVDYGCKIGKNVRLHCNIYVAQFTIIEDNVFMAPGVTIANDIHPECEFSRKCMRGPIIENSVKIGVNVTILPFVKIGAYSLIGSGSVVTKDIPPYSVAYGNPAKVTKKITDLKCLFEFTDKPYKFK
jgi:acetyltransferase-like isoleucine patch superfamily enzyme